MVKEHIKKISNDTLFVLGFNVINYLSSFMLAVLVSRFLGIGSFGEYSFIFAVILLTGIVSDFGLSTLLIRKINENRFLAGELVFTFNLIKTLLSLSVITILFFGIKIFFENYFYTAFFTGLLVILPRSLISTYESSMRSFLNQKYPVIFKSINSFLQLAVSYLLLVNGSGLAEIFLCILILDLITAVILHFANHRIISKFISDNNGNGSKFSIQSFKTKFIPLLRESSVFFYNNFLMMSIKGMNVILLGYFSTAVSVGIYSAGSRFVNGIGLFSGALFNSFYPVISGIKNDMRMKIDVARKLIFYSFTLGLALTAGLFFLSGYFIELTFKTEESVIILKILSFTMLPVLLYTVTQSFLFSVYGEKYLLKILIIAWSLNIILSIILIRAFDYTGCAIALTVTEVFLMLTQLIKFNTDADLFENQKVTLT